MANGDDQHPIDGEKQKEDSVTIVNTISIIVVCGYIAWMPLWMFFPPSKVPPEVLAILNNMIGAWGYAFAAVIGFHIGNTKTGKDNAAANQSTIKTLANTASTAASTAATMAAAPTPPAGPEKTVDTRTQTVTTEPAAPRPPVPPASPAAPEGDHAATERPVLPENNSPPKS